MKNKFLKSNIIRMWMASFFVLILFIAVSMLVSYGSTEQKLKAEMEQTNKAFMGERMRYVDSYVNNIVVGMMNISKLSDFDKISSVENFSKKGRSYDVSKFNEGMDSVEIEGVITEQRFVYLPQNNCIIGNGVARKPKDYFDITGIRGEYETWENSVLNTESKDMLCYDSENKLLYFRTWYHPVQSNVSDIMIVVAVSKAEFVKNFEEIPGMDFVITDTKGKQILSLTEENYDQLISKLEFKSTITTDIINHYIVSTEKGIGIDWNYLCIYDSNEYIKVFNTARMVVVLCIVLTGIAGLFIGYYFTKTNNRFIFKLSRELGADENADQKNEYAAIYDSVNKIIADANKKTTILYQQEQAQKNAVLKSVVSGEIMSADIDSKLKQSDIVFKHKCFGVAEIEIIEYSRIFFEENTDLKEALGLAKYIIANVYRDVFNDVVKFYPMEVGNNVVLLINCTECYMKDKADVNKLLNYGIAFIEENFNIKVKITVSTIVDSIENVQKCYRNVLWARDYRTTQNGNIFDCDDLEKNNILGQSYYYPIKSEQLLTADIKRGAYEMAETEFLKIFDTNIKKNTSPKFMKILSANIMGLIIRVVSSAENDKKEVVTLINETYQVIEEFESVELIKQKICETIKIVCDFINEDSQQNKRSIVEEVKKYINEHYANPELNAQYVAEWFNMKSAFLSTSFKKQEGIGLLEYITMVRIEAAKRMLLETDDIMSVVGEKAGFTSDRTFFRVFEKYVGVSPGKFKKQKLAEKNEHPDKT